MLSHILIISGFFLLSAALKRVFSYECFCDPESFVDYFYLHFISWIPGLVCFLLFFTLTIGDVLAVVWISLLYGWHWWFLLTAFDVLANIFYIFLSFGHAEFYALNHRFLESRKHYSKCVDKLMMKKFLD